MKKGGDCFEKTDNLHDAPHHHGFCAIFVSPDIEFDGTKATCSVRIIGDRTTDKIEATMELRQGSRLIDDWSASGNGFLEISKTATVARNTTYTLTVEYSVNGDSKTPVSISRTNR